MQIIFGQQTLARLNNKYHDYIIYPFLMLDFPKVFLSSEIFKQKIMYSLIFSLQILFR